MARADCPPAPIPVVDTPTRPRRPPELLRLTVTARGARRDLVLPALVPVVELVPELVTLLGAGGADLGGGWTLVGLDARPLDLRVGLLSQGVRDGAIVTLVGRETADGLSEGRGAGGGPHDDTAEAVADVLGGLGARWSSRHTAWATGCAAGALAALVLVGVVAQTVHDPDGRAAPGVAAAVACALLTGGVVLRRVRGEVLAGRALVLAAGPYAALAGLALAPGDPLGWPLVWAGGALGVVAASGPLALGEGHWLFHGVGIVAVVGAGLGAVHAVTGVAAPMVATVLVVAAVAGMRFVPWVALAMTGSVLTASRPLDVPVAVPEVRRSVQRFRALVLGVTAGVAVVVTACAPLVVGLGEPGVGIVLACGVLTLLRVRQLVLRLDILVGLASGAAIVVSGTVSTLRLEPGWAPWVTLTAGAAGLGAVAALVRPPRGSARWEQVLDLVEGLALGVLLPLLVVAVGLVAAVRGGG